VGPASTNVSGPVQDTHGLKTKNDPLKSYRLTLIKPKVHRQPNIRFFAHKSLSLGTPYLTNQVFNLIDLTVTLIHLPCASVAGLPSWPDYRI